MTSLYTGGGHSSHSIDKFTDYDKLPRRLALVKMGKSWTGHRVKKFCYCFLWLKRKWKWASCVTRWPLQNPVMASDANEKQRGRGMLGGDPFNAPRIPLPCPPRAPAWIKFHNWRWRKHLNWWSTVRQRERQRADGVTSCLMVTTKKKVSRLCYRLRLHNIKNKGDLDQRE